MSIDETKLAAILQERFGLSNSHLELARAWQKERGGTLADILFEMRAVSDDSLKKAHESLGAQAVAAQYTGRNRRRGARLTVLQDYHVSVRTPTKTEEAVIRDLSEGGMSIEVAGSPNVGEHIVVEVTSAGGTRVLCSGRVCHTKPTGQPKATVIGVEFENLSPVQKLAVAALFREAQKRANELTDVHWLD